MPHKIGHTPSSRTKNKKIERIADLKPKNTSTVKQTLYAIANDLIHGGKSHSFLKWVVLQWLLSNSRMGNYR